MHKLGDCNFFLSVVYVCFPGDFIAQGRVDCFPHDCEPRSLIHFGTVNFPGRELYWLLHLGTAVDGLELFPPC